MGSKASKTPSTKVELTKEAKEALAANGWDKGYVAFGFVASESVAKVAVGLGIAGIPDVKWVTVSFDDSELADIPEDFDPNFMSPGSTQKLGVKSELYKLITGGKAAMPALCIDGEMHMESVGILKMLAIEKGASKEVMELIDLSLNNDENNLQALKHWGWAGLHAAQNYAMVNKSHYLGFGKDNKTEAWEKDCTDKIKVFMDKQEEILAAKSEVNGCFYGDIMTLGDAALLNWVQSFEGVTGLDVKKYYPKCYANWEKIKENPPAGSQHFIYGFPVFCGYVAAANKDLREAGFDINKYWE